MASVKSNDMILPEELFRDDRTVAMDFGSSLAKIVTIEVDPFRPKHVTLRSVHFQRDAIDDIIEYFKKWLNTESPEDGRDMCHPKEITFTGVGVVQHTQRLEKELNIKIHSNGGFAMTARALICLVSYVPVKDVLHSQLISDIIEPRDCISEHAATMKQSLTHMPDMIMDFSLIDDMIQNLSVPELDLDRPMIDSCHPFPLLVAVFGSCLICLKVEKDGKFAFHDINGFGGKALFGKAKAFLGVKSFEEFLELAEKGRNENVDLYLSQAFGEGMGTEGPELPAAFSYLARRKNDIMAFHFGQAANLSHDHKYAREDVARALLIDEVMRMVESVYANAQLAGAHHVFVTGTMPTSDFVRRMITAEMTRRRLFCALHTSKKWDVQVHFVKCGAHLTAIGCLVKPPA